MTPAEIAIAITGLSIAGLVKGASGMGYSTTALPIIALAIGLDRAMPLVLLPSIASNLSVMASAGGFRESLQHFRWLYAALVPGLVMGLLALTWISASGAARVLGVIILVYVLYAATQPALQIPASAQRLLNVPVGFVNGVINGLTGSQIIPVVPYALSLRLTPDSFVQLANITFTLSSLMMLVGLQRIGFLDAHTLLISALGIIPGLAGVALGTRLRQHIAPEAFRNAVLAVLALMGMLLFAR